MGLRSHGPRSQPGADELQRRIDAWSDEWRAVAGSTAPADRPTAEAAIATLYEASGRPPPAIAWVPSPRAGMHAWVFASSGRGRVLSPFARGDVGSGRNREFNALAAPFGPDPRWVDRLATKVRGCLPQPGPANADSLQASVQALGLAGVGLPLRTILSALRDSAPLRLPPAPIAPEPAAVDAAAGVLGDTWKVLQGMFGENLARELFRESVHRLAYNMVNITRWDVLQAMQPGQWDVVTPVIAAARDVFGKSLWHPLAGRRAHEHVIDAHVGLARSAGPWWAVESAAIVSERPLVNHRDDMGRPHHASGPALAWPDGFEIYAWRGVSVGRTPIVDPASITIADIDAEQNVERRRVLVERFGADRLIREGGATLVHEDEAGRLWRRDGSARLWPRDEPVVMVEVVNATPEPDGTRRTYFLRVPPRMQTAREAVAWTFGLGAVEYRPAKES